MITCKGEIKFGRELRAREISKILDVFNITKPDANKPNNGLFPFKILNDFSGFTYNELLPIYEVESLLRILIEDIIPKDATLNGLLIYEDKETSPYGDFYQGYKVYVENNKITKLKMTEELPLVAKLLRCPHCQKAFKREDFKEVFD